MDCEQLANHSRTARQPKNKSAQRDTVQQQDKCHLGPPKASVSEIGISAQLQKSQTGRTNHHGKSAWHAQRLWNADHRVRGRHTEEVMQDRRRDGGRETQQEPEQNRLMKPAPRIAETVLLFEVTSLPLTAVEIPQASCIRNRSGHVAQGHSGTPHLRASSETR